jgi:hypothetical protein
MSKRALALEKSVFGVRQSIKSYCGPSTFICICYIALQSVVIQFCKPFSNRKGRRVNYTNHRSFSIPLLRQLKHNYLLLFKLL